MFKRIFFITLLLISQQAFAQELLIKVTPKQNYSTCRYTPQIGDTLDFVTVEKIAEYPKGTIVKGLLTDREENGFSNKVGSLYVEQFEINGKKLIGTWYQKGNSHSIYFEYFDWLISFPAKLLLDEEASYVRGGEAFLRPNKDFIILSLKD